MSSFLRTGTDPDDVIARVEAQIALAHESAQRARRFQDDVKAVRRTAESPRGHAAVSVDAGGRMTDVTLSPRAFELTPQQLSRLIVKTSRTAQRAAGARVLELAAEAFGPESTVLDQLRAELDEAVPSRRTTGRGLA